MRNPVRRTLILLFWLYGACALANGESIDPRTPQERHARQARESRQLEKWLPARIRHLQAEREQILEQIGTLPQYEPKPLTSQFGHHSVWKASTDGAETAFHQLTADMVFIPSLNAIGMVPAFDPLDPLRRTYGFPKRFKIEILEGFDGTENGVWVPREANEWTEVVNWLEEDFPDPGPYPVVFSDINQNVSKVRLSVPIDDDNSDIGFFALGEIYLFRNEDGLLADNMSVFGPTGIAFEASDFLSMPPVWDLQYLYDGVSGLGLPLSEKRTGTDDFIARFDRDSAPTEPVQIVLDLGSVQRIGRIEIWPSEAPGNMAVPLFGFPGSVMAELSVEPQFDEPIIVTASDARAQMHNDNLLTLICVGKDARYIRLSFDRLSGFMGNPILGLGEISVMEFGDVLSIGCVVSAQGIPAEYMSQLPRLVDGYSRNRLILPEKDWIIGLAKRRPLDARLALVEQELTAAREDWRILLFRISISGGIALLLLMLFGWGLLWKQRSMELKKLRLQITRDLHDEVGSSLGSISLASEQLENSLDDQKIKEELGELSLMAREANASLLEVVWVTDQETIFLPALIGKLVERAEKVLRNVQIVSNISPDIPDIKVNLTAKRHVILFFKEAIHNCARHAGATRVHFSAVLDNDHLALSLQDNGCGFNPDQKQQGWGLGSMKKRAGELGGNLEVATRPGTGTTIRLDVPIDSLSMNPTHSYKTSN